MASASAKPTVCLVIGMAGSGKTTLMQRLNAHVHEHSIPSYIINLDPAVANVPYGANIDIRDTVKYKEVMKQYNLGPNGGIVTSLNLFATRFDQVVNFVERKEGLKYVLVDTPGQIEVFTWSASGTIITESLASTFPTCILYVLDTPRNTNPITFMSNMLYACSIMYKLRLPFVLVFNKTDVTSHEYAVEWLSDFEAFQDAIASDTTYMSSLARSMSLVLEEFYQSLKAVGVSAVTGAGMDDLFAAIDAAAVEYEKEYKPDIERRMAEKKQKEEEKKQADIERLKKDLEESRGMEEVVPKGKEKLTSGGSSTEKKDYNLELREDSSDDEGEYNSDEDVDQEEADFEEAQQYQQFLEKMKISDPTMPPQSSVRFAPSASKEKAPAGKR